MVVRPAVPDHTPRVVVCFSLVVDDHVLALRAVTLCSVCPVRAPVNSGALDITAADRLSRSSPCSLFPLHIHNPWQQVALGEEPKADGMPTEPPARPNAGPCHFNARSTPSHPLPGAWLLQNRCFVMHLVESYMWNATGNNCHNKLRRRHETSAWSSHAKHARQSRFVDDKRALARDTSSCFPRLLPCCPMLLPLSAVLCVIARGRT